MILSDAMYGLKRDWGQPIKYRIMGTSAVDPASGTVTPTIQDISILSGVHVPLHIARSTAEKLQAHLFAVSGEHDRNTSVILIEKIDLPPGLYPKTTDTIQVGSQWYSIKAWEDLQVAYSFEVTTVEGGR